MANVRYVRSRAKAWFDVWASDVANIVVQPEMKEGFSKEELADMIKQLTDELEGRKDNGEHREDSVSISEGPSEN